MEAEDKIKLVESLFKERDELIKKANKIAKRQPKRESTVYKNMAKIVNLTVESALIQNRIHNIIAQPSLDYPKGGHTFQK